MAKFDHTPSGWQHIIGGRSPKWLNDFLNATFAWLIDSISIIIGFTGIPSNLLEGFLNNAFLAFQLIQHYGRRNAVPPEMVVRVRVTGGMEFTGVSIDPAAVDPDDVTMLEDLVLAAIRDAVTKAGEISEQAMGGLDLGGLGSGLFGG